MVVEWIQLVLYSGLVVYVIVSLYWIFIQHDIIDYREARRRSEAERVQMEEKTY